MQQLGIKKPPGSAACAAEQWLYERCERQVRRLFSSTDNGQVLLQHRPCAWIL